MEAPPLAFAVLYVSDIATASPFFERTLGLTPMPDLDLPAERQFAPGPHGAQLAVQPPHPGTRAGVVELHFSARDLPALRAAYVARGAEPSAISEDEFSTSFTLPVPDGEPLTMDQVRSTAAMVEAKEGDRGGADAPAPLANIDVPHALAYAILRVADFPAAAAYFTETLGFTPDPAAEGPGFCQFRATEGGIAFAVAVANDTVPAGRVELYISTPNASAAHRAMQTQGANIGPLQHMDFGDVFAAPAVDGVQFRVWQPQG